MKVIIIDIHLIELYLIFLLIFKIFLHIGHKMQFRAIGATYVACVMSLH